jgi:hypothetical protein
MIVFSQDCTVKFASRVHPKASKAFARILEKHGKNSGVNKQALLSLIILAFDAELKNKKISASENLQKIFLGGKL